jgi:hypothetical protein
MNRFLSLIISISGVVVGVVSINSCSGELKKEMVTIPDNVELIEIAEKDQQMRQNDTLDMEPVDKVHRLKVMNLLANDQVKTSNDKLNAALILQHTALRFCNGELVSISPENYYLAYELSKSVFDSGYKKSADMVAATYDRYLLYTQGYQKYGTQRVYDEKTNQEVWAPIDSNTTDTERKRYNIKPLKELLKEYKMKPFPAAKN